MTHHSILYREQKRKYRKQKYLNKVKKKAQEHTKKKTHIHTKIFKQRNKKKLKNKNKTTYTQKYFWEIPEG